jgi:hypothetical protein
MKPASCSRPGTFPESWPSSLLGRTNSQTWPTCSTASDSRIISSRISPLRSATGISLSKNEKQASPAWRQTVQILGMAYYFNRRWTEAAPLIEKACTWSLGARIRIEWRTPKLAARPTWIFTIRIAEGCGNSLSALVIMLRSQVWLNQVIAAIRTKVRGRLVVDHEAILNAIKTVSQNWLARRWSSIWTN